MKILIVGSLVMDTITSTEVFPEVSATVLGTGYITAPGGKGANQAAQCALLGAEVSMLGKVGQDAFGDRMIAALNERGVDTTHIGRAKEGISTGTSCIIVTQKNGRALNNRIIVVSGSNMEIVPEDLAYLEEEIENYDMLMLQLEIPMEINEMAAEIAHRHGVPVMLNPAPIAPLSKELCANATYISPNEVEVQSLLDCGDIKSAGITEASIAALRDKKNALGIDKLMVTLGDQGALLIDEGHVLRPCVKDVDVQDPTAAGDSFVASFCVAKTAGLGDAEAIEFANIVAAITVSSMGAMPSLPTIDRVLSYAQERNLPTDAIRKVMAAKEN